MADDIVTRLGRTKFMQHADVETLCDEAAAEIERLRTVVDPEFFMLHGRIDILEREIERLRRDGDSLFNALEWSLWGSNVPKDVADAMTAWQEARRG